jgi:hypothetical protein
LFWGIDESEAEKTMLKGFRGKDYREYGKNE